MAVSTHEFWRRAQLSKDVLTILNALDAAASHQLTETHANILKSAVDLLQSAETGALNIKTPDISNKWALDTLRFQSAADALSRLSSGPKKMSAEVVQHLKGLQDTLSALASHKYVEPKQLEVTRMFFRAFEDSLVQRLGSFQERPPLKYL